VVWPNDSQEASKWLPSDARTGQNIRADARNRTGDPFITSEVLYQLSYVGVCRNLPGS
jgi:hypothetical protein